MGNCEKFDNFKLGCLLLNNPSGSLQMRNWWGDQKRSGLNINHKMKVHAREKMTSGQAMADKIWNNYDWCSVPFPKLKPEAMYTCRVYG
jgi:hypothetical protein